MSHSYYITREVVWWQSALNPIREEEWIAYVNADPHLEFARKGNIVKAIWRRNDGDSPVLNYGDGKIWTAHPDDMTLEEMQKIATSLHARFHDEEGKPYNQTLSFFAGEVIASPTDKDELASAWFKDRDSQSGYVVLSRSLDDSQVYCERDDQGRATYDDMTSILLCHDQIKLTFDIHAAKELGGVSKIIVRFALHNEQFQRLHQTLLAIFHGKTDVQYHLGKHVIRE